ncbi:MAG: hypothetical protein J6Z49_12385, partial [Kiritimatiellae bacterium]|nr:hypothetical protein [Kiritimatiellia bacterium]
VENFNKSPCSTRLIRKVSTTPITWERAYLRFSTVRLGTGDNRDNNLKRRGGHERRTTDLLRPDGLRDSGNVSRVGGEQIRLLDNSLNASVKWKV